MNQQNLFILWTNADEITFEKMIFMYSVNSLVYGWWDHITVIIWGAPTKLASENEKVRELIQMMMEKGVHVSACKKCSDELGVTKELEDLGIEVKYWGQGLTEILKGEDKLLTI
ncbi:MAG: DsrE family protein [Bacillota bacterium]